MRLMAAWVHKADGDAYAMSDVLDHLSHHIAQVIAVGVRGDPAGCAKLTDGVMHYITENTAEISNNLHILMADHHGRN